MLRQLRINAVTEEVKSARNSVSGYMTRQY